MDANSYDVVVVGNGVLGLSLATALGLRSSGRIALIGDESRTYAATPAAGAMLGCFGEATTTLLATPFGRTKLGLAVRAGRMWDDWLARLAELAPAEPGLITADGTMVILNTVGGDMDDANFRAVETAALMHNATAEPVSIDKIPWMDPDPNARPLQALYLPGERAVDASRLLSRLQEAAIQAGVDVHYGIADRVETSGGRATGITMRDGTTLHAGQVVLATGARTNDLLAGLDELRYRVPLVFGGCGVSVLLNMAEPAGPPFVLRTPNRAFACGLHLVPRSAGTAYVGATNMIALKPRSEPVAAEVLQLLSYAAYQLHTGFYGADIGRIQVGNRPVAIDGFPLIGPTDSVAGLWLATGTYRDGLHLSPLLAQQLAAELNGEQGIVDLSMFRPERDLIQPFTRDEVVADVVKHTLATGFEQPWRVSPRWPQFVAPMMAAHYRSIADDLSDLYTPPAEFLSALNIGDDGGQDELKTYYKEVARTWHAG